jgi:hypothetical protein
LNVTFCPRVVEEVLAVFSRTMLGTVVTEDCIVTPTEFDGWLLIDAPELST